jgi:hypothetical protein
MGNTVPVNLTLVTVGIHDENDVSYETMEYQKEDEVFNLQSHTIF